MIVLDFNGKEIKWNFSKFYDRKNRSGKSKYHISARDLISELFPNSSVYEEVTIPTNPSLYADFFLPDRRIMFEVHGEQHYTFNSFFHKSKLEFFRAKARDKKKIEWCNINDIKLITLPYEKMTEWKKMIQESIYQ